MYRIFNHSPRAAWCLAFAALVITAHARPAHAQLACQAEWEQVDHAAPVARWWHAAAYDTHRHVMVLFGGRGAGGETWEWQSATDTWRLAATTGPANRAGAAMAYDRARQRTIMTGGGALPQREVWSWNGTSWTLLAPLPDGRFDHAMAYDIANDRMVLYGGSDGTNARRTLLFDGQSWEVVATPPLHPGIQFGCAMAYDASRQRIVLAESSENDPSIEIFEWDGSARTWSLSTPKTNPGGRKHPVLTYDEVREEVLIVGGDNNDETWAYDGSSWIRRNDGGPGGRDRHTLVYDTLRSRALLFGGTHNGRIAARRDLLAWNSTAGTWSTLSDTASPAPRSIWHAMAYDSARAKTVVYGGLLVNSSDFVVNEANNATWEWDGAAWAMRATTGNPGSRFRSAMVYDSTHGVTILYGGAGATNIGRPVQSSTWRYDGAAWTNDSPSSNPALGPRQQHAMAFDSERARVVLFGGNTDDDNPPLGETWEYDSAKHLWSRVATAGPPARNSAAMAFDRTRGMVVLFGGSNSAGVRLADTWTWDGKAQLWTQVTAPGPPARSNAGMTYDPVGRRVVLHGGFVGDSAPLNDLWAFDGVRWTEITTDSEPFARGVHGLVFDEGRGRLVTFGGRTVEGGNNANDFANAQTWEATLPCPTDFNCDAQANIQDFLAFLGAFSVGDIRADFNGDGTVTVQDFLAFTSAYAAGC